MFRASSVQRGGVSVPAQRVKLEPFVWDVLVGGRWLGTVGRDDDPAASALPWWAAAPFRPKSWHASRSLAVDALRIDDAVREPTLLDAVV